MTAPARPIARPPGNSQSSATGAGKNPFQSGAEDERFYFREHARERYLNLILHLAPYSEVLLVVGQQSSGKTYLLNRLLSNAADTWRVCRVNGGADVDGERLLEILDKELSLRPSMPGTREERTALLRQSLHAQRRGGLVPIVIVDDADKLPVAALSTLALLAQPWENGEKVLGVVLFGERGLEHDMATAGLEALRARVSHAFDLPPLSERDTAAYINHRLDAAGVEGRDGFTPSIYRSIHSQSGGLPGRINELAGEILRGSQPPKPAPEVEAALTIEAPRTPWLRYLLVPAAAAAILALIFTYREQVDDAVVSAWLAATDTVTSIRGQLAGGATPNAALPAGIVQPASQGLPPAGEAAGRTSPAADASPATVDQAGTLPAEVSHDASAPDVTAPEPPPSPAPAAAEPPTPPAAAAAPVKPARNQVAASGGADAGPRKPIVQGPHDEDWLLSQPEGRYTVQMIVKGSPETAAAFIEAKGLQDGAAVYRIPGQNGLLYAVVYGIYSSYDEARAAAARLGAKAPGLKPWARSIDLIQRQIAETGTQAIPPPPPPPPPATENSDSTQ